MARTPIPNHDYKLALAAGLLFVHAPAAWAQLITDAPRAVDRSVADTSANAASLRYVDPGLSYHATPLMQELGDGNRLLNRPNPYGTGASDELYLYTEPGVRAVVRLPNYVQGRSGLQQVITADTVFDLTLPDMVEPSVDPATDPRVWMQPIASPNLNSDIEVLSSPEEQVEPGEATAEQIMRAAAWREERRQLREAYAAERRTDQEAKASELPIVNEPDGADAPSDQSDG